MTFEPINFSHKTVVDHAFKLTKQESADSTFVNLWLWRFAREIAVANHGGFVFVRQQEAQGEPSFLMPMGAGAAGDQAGDQTADHHAARSAFDALSFHAKSEGCRLRFKALTESDRLLIHTLFPDQFAFTPTPSHDDYLYDTNALIKLAGREYHTKKNFVNRFETMYGINYERLNDENLAECLHFIDRWFEKAPYKADAEHKGIVELLREYKRFECTYGMLRAEGQIAGFTLGERLAENCVVIHIEKADGVNFQGSYQTINKVHLEREWAHTTIVNREEDLGLEGLRKAKLSYQPIGYVRKFDAVRKETGN